MDEVNRCVDSFIRLEKNHGDLQLRFEVFLHLECLSRSLLNAEEFGISPRQIKKAVEPLWKIFGEAPFLRRIQEWPRGYPGDFETIEYLVNGRNTCKGSRVAFLIEEYFLRSSTAQQHKNKLEFQRRAISDAIAKNGPNTKILSIASGSALDLQWCANLLAQERPHIALNDQDIDALNAAKSELSRQGLNLTLFPGNALRFMLRKQAPNFSFDLVIAGGLFDYLSDKTISRLIKLVYSNYLNENGLFVFTNIAKGNPLRLLMEYTADWHLRERDERDYEALVLGSIEQPASFDISRDATGLSLLMALKR